MQRRHFLQQSILCASASLVSFPGLSNWAPSRKFTMSLDPGAIGVAADQRQLIDWAAEYGFEAVSPFPTFLAEQDEAARADLLATMKEKNIGWGVAGLPVEFRKEATTFRTDLKALPRMAKALHQAGATRIGTWIMPNHAELNYLKNFQQHTDRLREVATVLQDYNLRLGLEYVGPKTLRNAQKYAFIATLEETQALIDAIGLKNVGVTLDSFHWYTAEESVDDILTLTNTEIVACDLNDARRGRGPQEQLDGERELPMATGLIPAKEFLEALVKVGYDGPVRAEPFSQPLNDTEDQQAIATTARAMKQAFALLG